MFKDFVNDEGMLSSAALSESGYQSRCMFFSFVVLTSCLTYIFENFLLILKFILVGKFDYYGSGRDNYGGSCWRFAFIDS